MRDLLGRKLELGDVVVYYQASTGGKDASGKIKRRPGLRFAYVSSVNPWRLKTQQKGFLRKCHWTGRTQEIPNYEREFKPSSKPDHYCWTGHNILK